jgi:HEAT repeat protein
LVSQVDVAPETLQGNSMLAMNPAQVEEWLVYKLRQHRFEFASGPGPSKEQSLALRLNIPFTREASKEGRDGTYAEVGAALTMRRQEEGGFASYEVVGIGESRLPSDDPQARRAAMRSALSSALDQVASSGHLQLAALEKSDSALVRDLSAKDPRVREFAVRVLSARKNPAVQRALLERLESSDPDVVRRAIGALVELKNPGAVPALIDLAKGKAPGFIREIVFALGEIGGEEAEAYLYTVAQGHDQPAVRDAAQKALDDLRAKAKTGSADQTDPDAARPGSGGSP